MEQGRAPNFVKLKPRLFIISNRAVYTFPVAASLPVHQECGGLDVLDKDTIQGKGQPYNIGNYN